MRNFYLQLFLSTSLVASPITWQLNPDLEMDQIGIPSEAKVIIDHCSDGTVAVSDYDVVTTYQISANNLVCERGQRLLEQWSTQIAGQKQSGQAGE